MSIDWINGSPDEFARKLRDPGLLQGPVRRFLESAALVVQGHAREASPVDTGRLRQSITYHLDASPMPLYAKVGSNVQYAPFMEYGTGALSDKPAAVSGWQFPDGPELDVWARRHGFDSGKTVASIIRWKGGLTPRRYLRQGMAAAKREVKQLLRGLAIEIERMWSK